MVFKKPYAFFIKYFKLINLILSVLNIIYIYKLNLLHRAVNDIYFGRLTNFTNLDSDYIGFVMYLLVFIISIIILAIILTLRKKQKPFRDYLYNLIYNVLLIAYLLSVGNMFLELYSGVVEQTTLKLYSDISLLVMVPLIYFLIKYILIVIGFSINKFNFQKDIIEFKKAEEDNEEIEVIFDKNSYKTKRKIRKTFREFKYYILENKLIFTILCFIIVLISLFSLFSKRLFDKNIVNVGQSFVAGDFSYIVTDIYETKYDLSYNLIKDNSKFVIVNINVRNNMNVGKSIDFKRVRLFYEDQYVYLNNYYNKFLYDFNPYNGETLNSGENSTFAFIFKVPSSYKSNKYTLKFYDRLVPKDSEIVGNYKTIKVTAKNLDNKFNEINASINENINLNKNIYGNSSLKIDDYSLEKNYIFNDGYNEKIVRDSNINNILLILNYKLFLDEKSKGADYIKNDKDFFENYVSLDYEVNKINKSYDKIKVIECFDNKIFLGVPYNLKSADTINLIIKFRNEKIIYKLK